MKATSTLWPSARSPWSVDEESRQWVPDADALAHRHHGALVDARALVAAEELHQWIDDVVAVVVAYDDLVAADAGDNALCVGEHHLPAVQGYSPLHAGTHQRGLRLEQGHRLSLHVGSHECPVGVVVLQEGDEGGGGR